MRTYKIKRRESGRFYLFSLYGTGRCLHEQEWDLALDVSESKAMLIEMFKSIRPEELPLEDREPLINSVSELIPVQKNSNLITNGNTPTGRIQLPSENNYPLITINFPGAI
jgi:hypothetical protein